MRRVPADQVYRAKPASNLFLTAAGRLELEIESAIAVGDCAWDLLAARRARALCIGILTAGYGHAELETAGACRIYEDTARSPAPS